MRIPRTDRRTFLKSGLATGALLGLGGPQAALRAFAQDSPTEQIRELMLHETPYAKGKAKKKLSILILGGTAFLGPATVEIARARGHEITLFNRGRTNSELFPGIEQIHGDRMEGHEALAGKKWDVVIDNSGYFPRVVKDAAETLRDNVDHYLFISTISVFASHAEIGIDETAPVGTLEDPTVEEITGETYGPLKAYCEKAAEEAMPGRVTVVRPGLIVGPMDRSDRYTYWPVRVARGGEVLAPGTPDQGIQWIDVRDLASFVVRCVEEKHLGTYNATSKPGAITMGAMLDSCKKVSGSDATFTWADADFLEEYEVNAWSDMPCWIPPTGDYAGFGSINVDRAVKAGLDFRPLEVTAADTLKWWKSQPENEEKRTETRSGLSAEREAEVLAAWHAREAG